MRKTLAEPMIRRAGLIAAAGLLTMHLSGCGNARANIAEAIGVKHRAPDAFNVVPRKPLALPPSVAELPQPTPGAASPLDPDPIASARAALGQTGPVASGPTSGEAALLAAAGADQADPEVRARTAEESQETSRRYGLTSLFGYTAPDGSEAETLDTDAEAERLRNAGATPPTAPPRKKPRPSNILF